MEQNTNIDAWKAKSEFPIGYFLKKKINYNKITRIIYRLKQIMLLKKR